MSVSQPKKSLNQAANGVTPIPLPWRAMNYMRKWVVNCSTGTHPPDFPPPSTHTLLSIRLQIYGI